MPAQAGRAAGRPAGLDLRLLGQQLDHVLQRHGCARPPGEEQRAGAGVLGDLLREQLAGQGGRGLCGGLAGAALLEVLYELLLERRPHVLAGRAAIYARRLAAGSALRAAREPAQRPGSPAKLQGACAAGHALPQWATGLPWPWQGHHPRVGLGSSVSRRPQGAPGALAGAPGRLARHGKVTHRA